MKISDCAAILQTSHRDQRVLQAQDVELTDLTQNTKEVKPGCCFVAIKGVHFDGHEHIQEVVDAGAKLVIVERPVEFNGDAVVVTVPNTYKALAQLSTRFFGDPSRQLTMFGVTGTNGKTTITHLIDQIMEDHGVQTGIIGTMYSKVGTKKLPAVNTTPEPLTAQRTLSEMVAANDQACAMEVSSIALVQGRAWGIDFDTVVFTNLTEDHLDYHKTFENYFDAKALLFSQLGNSYHVGEKTKSAVINIDDPHGKRLLEKTAANILTYGAKGEGILQAKNIQVTNKDTKFDLQIYDETYPVQLKLMGNFNVYNALAAFGACYEQGLEPAEIITSLESVKGVRGRFQVVPNEKDVTVIVDYAHTPDGLENVLSTINAFAKQRVFCVVGCGGDRETTKRPIMGNIAVQHSTDAVLTSDNPRTEDPEKILDQVVAELKPGTFTRMTDRRAAINFALGEAKAGDVVLIAGKGHEDYQIIGTVKHHFDDVEVVNDFYKQEK
ncbi:UDP-N-acetylmuramoyl-L-alanyl-D-glutamate--2,6-diaminopimelate ligase [Lapidilactobacillus mulanensis]|uniref:UDP-N-acetylmuramoyl-L-alanyl-D-glutamate--2,6-diaminopimelate ligase n=1 Tax=Lapidilactobacillus mulanensis TaxID=2485999 RepID=A0ABW4DP82_9LACO|nr:UDP-N-acetylmuramoyl-L-alanyl-D-glutamate--2,6-diaminopimelate ligase [Lapidilactobacillus mulanensis]